MAIKIGNTFGPNNPEKFFVSMLAMQEDFTARKHLYGATAAFCPRQNFLMSRDWPSATNVSSASSLYMNIGNGIETAIVEGLIKNNRLFDTNIYLPAIEPKVSGKIDIIYADESDSLALGEIKSCGTLPTEPKFGHFWQTATYAAISGIDNVNIIYMSRNVVDFKRNIAIRVFKVDITPHLLTQVFAKILVSQTSIDEGWMPPIPATFRKSGECNFCMFNGSVCWTPSNSIAAPETQFESLTPNAYLSRVDALAPQIEALIESRRDRLQTFLGTLATKTTDEFLLGILAKAQTLRTTKEALQ